MKTNQKKKIFFILLFFITVIIFFNLNKKKIGQLIQINLPYKISQSAYLFYDPKKVLNRVANDYNVNFLPKTELINLEVKKISIKDYLTYDSSSFYLNSVYKYKSFYLEEYLNKIIILNNNGSIFYADLKSLREEVNSLKKIESNLGINFNALDIFIDNDHMYISGTVNLNNCRFMTLYKSKINFKKLNFENIFYSNECSNIVRGGKIQKIEIRNKILLSTFADPWEKNLIEYDYKPQDDNSIFGKILLIDEVKKNYSIYSKGHRNIQGLISINKDVVLATEHGPKGGDEINRIIQNHNYGWNEVSYGQKYFTNQRYDYEHQKKGYQEPIFVFIPSIGISELIFLGNNFADEWDSDFLIASLNSRSLYRVRFDNEFNKLIYYEKIFVGERIRDLKLISDKKTLLLALEESGSVLILKKN